MEQKGRTAKSAITLTTISILTKPINFLKEIIIAAYFGASAFKDAFLIAWAIPNIFASFVTEGLSQVFVPIFIEKIQSGNEKEAWKIASIISNVIIAIFVVLTLLIILLAPFLVNLIASQAPLETKLYAVRMTRILSFSVIALSISALLTSILNSYRRFIAPALTFAIMNLVIIGSVIFFYKALGVYALALGFMFGTFSMIFIQIPSLVREKIHYRFSFDITNKGVLTFAQRMSPMILAAFIFGLMGIIEKVFASGLSVGSISSLDYGFRIIHFVFSIFVPTVTTAAFPTMSLYALDKVKDRFVRSVWSTIKMVELFIIPTSVFLIIFNHYIIKAIYERGAFTSDVTLISSRLMAVFATGLFAYAAAWILFHAFYALKDTTVRVKASLIILLVYVLSNLVLVRYLGIIGLPISHVVAWIVDLLFLLKWFIEEDTLKGFVGLLISLFQILIASLIPALFFNFFWLRSEFLFLTFVSRLVLFCFMFIAYFLIYLLIYLKISNDRDVVVLVQNGFRRFFKKK